MGESVEDSIPGAAVTSVSTDTTVGMEVTVTIDATNSESDIDDTTSQIVEDLDQEGFESFAEGNKYLRCA